MFDGNWWGKRDHEVEDEAVFKHLMEKVEQNHKDYIEDMEFEDEMEEAYLKLTRT